MFGGKSRAISRLSAFMTEKSLEKLKFENEYRAKGFNLIAGADEVGRGPLAGPVVCCAVIMPLDDDSIIEGVDDSKKLSAKKRERLAEEILARAVAVKICRKEPKEIDEINILEATKRCMADCVNGLSVKPDVLFADALNIKTDVPCVPIVHGDALSYSIGCASIVAKVFRDKLMDEYAEKYPAYLFEKNKGYGTAAHIKAIKEIGPCELHRRSFIKNFWDEAVKGEPKNS